MTEPDRITCCIVGCRRTFKRRAGETETMCAKHYRGDRALVAARKDTLRVARRYIRIVRKLEADPSRLGADLRKALFERYRAALAADWTAWEAIKAHAQQLQDAGYWVRPVKRRVGFERKSKAAGKPDGAAVKFEDQFQRLKLAQQRGHHA